MDKKSEDKQKTGMTGQQCIECIKVLSSAYGGIFRKIYERVKELERDNPEAFKKGSQMLEAEKFQSQEDFMSYLVDGIGISI